MDDFDNLERLAKLRDKDIINEEEFVTLKRNIVSRNIGMCPDCKSGVAYALLAWFLGMFGAHNFYAGYTKRAIAQLLLTVFSWILFFIPLVVVQIWALADMCLINKDAQGRPFKGDKTLVLIIRITAVAFYVISYLIAFMGIIAAVVAGGKSTVAAAPLTSAVPPISHGTIIYH